MSRLADEGRARLKSRAGRLVRLIELNAPDTVLINESYLIAEAAQLMSASTWHGLLAEQAQRENKRKLGLCREDGCEALVVWAPNPLTAPKGPLDMDYCKKHASEDLDDGPQPNPPTLTLVDE